MPSVRKSYDEELLQLDTLLARMGHEAGAAIESALTALRMMILNWPAAWLRGTARSTQVNTRSNTAACSCCCASSRWLRICARSVQP